MVENPRSEEEKIIKDIRNIFRLKKEQNDIAIKDIRDFFRLEKEVKGIKDLVLRNIKNLFEYEKEEENYYKPVVTTAVTIILNTKITVIKIEYYQLKNILIKLERV